MAQRFAAAALTAWTIIASVPAAADEASPPAPAGDYLARLKTYEEEVEAFRGTAALKAYGATEGYFNAAFAYVRPDRGRLELSTPLGGTALVITGRGDEMLLYYPLDDVAVVGAGAEWTFAGMPVASGGFYQLFDWLAARPPLYEAEVRAGAVTLAVEPTDDGNAALTWRRTSDGTRVQLITVAPEPFRLLNARLFEGDEAVFDATYDDWRAGGGATMPYALTLKAEETLVEVAVKKLETNVPLDDGAFATAPPEGAAVMASWPPPAELEAGE